MGRKNRFNLLAIFSTLVFSTLFCREKPDQLENLVSARWGIPDEKNGGLTGEAGLSFSGEKDDFTIDYQEGPVSYTFPSLTADCDKDICSFREGKKLLLKLQFVKPYRFKVLNRGSIETDGKSFKNHNDISVIAGYDYFEREREETEK